MAKINVEYSGELFDDPQRLMKRIFGDAMLETVMFAETQVAKKAPVGATGNLRAGIFGKLVQYNRGIVGVQGPAMRYAEVVEHGRKPGKWPPRAPIELWVKRVIRPPRDEFDSVVFLVQRKIGRKGTKGKLMFKKSEKVVNRLANKTFEKARDLIERLLSDK